MEELAQRYAPGGDIYAANEARYGTAGADLINRGFIRDGRSGAAIAAGNLHTPTGGGSTSTAAIFLDQITTDPLAAPLESANKVIGNSVSSFLKNPWVVALTLAAILGAIVYTGDKFGLLKRFKK
jgi:hypothetical protein